MKFYSGTSRHRYEFYQQICERNPSGIAELNCHGGSMSRLTAVGLAIGYAKKAARADRSVPIVVEITAPDEFERTEEGFYILRGRLTPTNHKVHDAEKLAAERSVPVLRMRQVA